jgi:hypothetical protein
MIFRKDLDKKKYHVLFFSQSLQLDYDLFVSRAKILYNILKEISASITVYLDTKHCRLEQCNGKPALAIESFKDSVGEVRLSFCWDAFGIERMVGEKMVNSSFGGARGPGIRTPSVGTEVDMPWV